MGGGQGFGFSQVLSGFRGGNGLEARYTDSIDYLIDIFQIVNSMKVEPGLSCSAVDLSEVGHIEEVLNEHWLRKEGWVDGG